MYYINYSVIYHTSYVSYVYMYLMETDLPLDVTLLLRDKANNIRLLFLHYQ